MLLPLRNECFNAVSDTEESHVVLWVFALSTEKIELRHLVILKRPIWAGFNILL